MAIRFEPMTLLPGRSSGVAQGTTLSLFNAALAFQDEQGADHPYLAETLPKLNTESWRLFPDGQMETTYRLRPNLVWHDGSPLPADDFAFANEVYRSPDFGMSGVPPLSLMESITAPDIQTLIIRWKRPYPDAGSLGDKFSPLPRHILETGVRDDPRALLLSPFWTREYVGLGPYKVAAWEPGTFMEGTAFAGHSLGAPKIDRVRLQFINDANVIVAGLLAGSIDVVVDNGIRPEQGAELQRQWASSEAGGVVSYPSGSVRYVYAQLQPELAQPQSLLDIRVRRALAYSIDKRSLIEGLSEGLSVAADTLAVPNADYFGAVDAAISKYVYDPRRTEQLLAEVGFSKASDGFYTSPATGKFTVHHQVNAGNPAGIQEQAILVDTWRRSGLDFTSSVLSIALQQDGQVRASFPGLASTLCPCSTSALDLVSSRGIPTLENGWLGNNRGHWSNPDFDQLSARFDETLDRSERAAIAARLMKQVSEELPGFPLYYDVTSIAYAADLQGPLPGAKWNLYLWHWR